MKASEQVHLQMILKRLSHCMASILSELPLFFSLFSPPASIKLGFPLKCCFKFVAILVFLGFHLPLALLRKKKEVKCENAKSQNKKCLIIQVLRINCRLFKQSSTSRSEMKSENCIKKFDEMNHLNIQLLPQLTIGKHPTKFMQVE